VIAAVYNRLRFIPRFLAVSSACVKIFSGIEMAVFNDFIKSSLYFGYSITHVIPGVNGKRINKFRDRNVSPIGLRVIDVT
jgi:hypothetical protein